MKYVAKFAYEPLRNVWTHGASGASVTHWDVESADRMPAIAERAVRHNMKHTLADDAEISVEFDVSTYKPSGAPSGFAPMPKR